VVAFNTYILIRPIPTINIVAFGTKVGFCSVRVTNKLDDNPLSAVRQLFIQYNRSCPPYMVTSASATRGCVMLW
jgi:hypothetical protein